MADRRLANESRYDRMARSYRFVTRLASLGTIGALYRAAADALDPGARSLVDVGCGPATLTPYLIERVGPDAEITGIDLSREMIAAAERESARRGWRDVRFVRASALEYAPRNAPDAVVFCLSLSLLPDPELAALRALSWLRPGGQLVVVDSIPDPTRPIRSFLIRAKAGRVGAEPDAFPLALLRSRLEGFRERRMHGGVYSLITGRKPPTLG